MTTFSQKCYLWKCKVFIIRNMVRKSLLTLMLLYTICINLTAQSETEFVVMDNYTIPTGIEGAIVGRVISPHKEVMFLDKDTSELFIFDRQNYIRLKDGVTLRECDPQCYEIEMQCGENVKSFVLVKDDFIRNGVIANGGAWKNTHLKFNSVEALKKAVEIGCEASRCDVYLNADKQIELIPDQYEDYNDVFTIEECIQDIKKQNKTRLVINLKDLSKNKNGAVALADSVVRLVHRLNAQAWVEYVSFDYETLLRIRQQDSSALISYTGSDKTLEEQANDNISGVGYNFNLYIKSPELFEQARNLGLTLRVWTVNNKRNMQYFLDNGINYITTDEPEMMLQLVSE